MQTLCRLVRFTRHFFSVVVSLILCVGLLSTQNTEAIVQDTQPYPIQPYADCPGQTQGFIPFPPNSSEISAKSSQIFDDYIKLWNGMGKGLVLVRSSIDGSEAQRGQQILSEARAQTVQDYLVSNGVSLSDIWMQHDHFVSPYEPNDLGVENGINRAVQLRLPSAGKWCKLNYRAKIENWFKKNCWHNSLSVKPPMCSMALETILKSVSN